VRQVARLLARQRRLPRGWSPPPSEAQPFARSSPPPRFVGPRGSSRPFIFFLLQAFKTWAGRWAQPGYSGVSLAIAHSLLMAFSARTTCLALKAPNRLKLPCAELRTGLTFSRMSLRQLMRQERVWRTQVLKLDQLSCRPTSQLSAIL